MAHAMKRLQQVETATGRVLYQQALHESDARRILRIMEARDKTDIDAPCPETHWRVVPMMDDERGITPDERRSLGVGE